MSGYCGGLLGNSSWSPGGNAKGRLLTGMYIHKTFVEGEEINEREWGIAKIRGTVACSNEELEDITHRK